LPRSTSNGRDKAPAQHSSALRNCHQNAPGLYLRRRVSISASVGQAPRCPLGTSTGPAGPTPPRHHDPSEGLARQSSAGGALIDRSRRLESRSWRQFSNVMHHALEDISERKREIWSSEKSTPAPGRWKRSVPRRRGFRPGVEPDFFRGRWYLISSSSRAPLSDWRRISKLNDSIPGVRHVWSLTDSRLRHGVLGD